MGTQVCEYLRTFAMDSASGGLRLAERKERGVEERVFLLPLGREEVTGTEAEGRAPFPLLRLCVVKGLIPRRLFVTSWELSCVRLGNEMKDEASVPWSFPAGQDTGHHDHETGVLGGSDAVRDLGAVVLPSQHPPPCVVTTSSCFFQEPPLPHSQSIWLC